MTGRFVTSCLARLFAPVALLVLCLGGCAQKECPETDQGTPVDPALLGFISRSRAAHHLADGREERADLKGAQNALSELIDGPLPEPSDAAEVREVLADTRARAADLRSRQGDFEGALADIEAGLALVPETNYFRGHLMETRGLVEERLSNARREAGDAAGAEKARERALSAFEEAMRIQAAVIGGGAPPSKRAPAAP